MIKREDSGKNKVKVTFVMPYEEGQAAISVLGDFNDWDPAKTKLIKRRNSTCSNSVVLEAGQRYRFRYYTADGNWINDPEADGYEASEHGSENCILAL
ncbi:MAG: isoamylase early set domain-containing protein [Caldilinea sp.]|nr:isoamylase early set domain-containing protein [Caldilinea sp.]MCB0051672.1 isoamylase early set domain-containing protein [Caldilinea sp.]MCB0069256.1 isoamylase early set domain-containing protein [Caldilineaceae bacterium]MCB0148103.1 isoamylase early set domain-containing protein [Caldilineaceae bacterium]MCW5843712.1 isoamylase early set domain-containing protein [Caldilinea sp.]